MATDGKTPLEGFKAYEDGKQRRYNLLFAVNGGAFAIVKLLAEKDARVAIGGLPLGAFAWGMAGFTVVMAFDIGAFGYKMRKRGVEGAFEWPGWVVLGMITALLGVAWIWAASAWPPAPPAPHG